ncbi:MAG: N-acetyl-gamma-glutamyl-phosphate reductase, partial [Candidatus Dadabacteria bacterium]|nr:N-acetyl-gamma-glutamyl-phosphate reductase [Candidatus Dadabacteria bacterium]
MEKNKIRVSVLGASGYTGSDLLRLLLIHPEVEIAHITADKHAGKNISDVLPHLRSFLKLELQPLDVKSIPDDIEIVFAALPHGA